MTSLSDQLDQQVTLQGPAMDAHAGAAVLLDNGGAVYVDGLKAWPKELRGQQVEVTGTLRRRSLAPDPVVDDQGLVSHGMAGRQLVLADPVWARIG